LDIILQNAAIAAAEALPLCQDCGSAVVFAELGQDAYISGGDFYQAINQGIAEGYEKNYLRKSICHPFTRANNGNNTPAIVHLTLTPGDKLTLTLAPKGGGAENTSRLLMLTPAQGRQGVIQAVLETVKQAGGNPCPPIIVGAAVGGNFENAALRAKRALMRPLDAVNPDAEAAELEQELMQAINQLDIGPAGLGGGDTCLGVMVDIAPCHIASLPLALNIQCHAARHQAIVL
jgi:fumarate hydratase subunit alpha